MKKNNLLLLIFILTFIFSCDSDDDDDVDVSGIGYKLVKIETYRMPNDELKETTIFEYNEDGFVSKATKNHYYSGTSTINYIYINGKITTIDYVDPDGSENLTYTDELLKIKFIGQNNVLTNNSGNIVTYEYNDNDYPSKQYNYYIGEFITYSLYTYEEI